MAALTTASAGCLDGGDRTHPTARLDGDSTYIRDVELQVVLNQPMLLDSLRLHVRLNSDSIGALSGLVLISPSDSQIAATEVLSGETTANLEPQSWEDGRHSILVVSGGEFDRRGHSGGEVLETVPVVISDE